MRVDAVTQTEAGGLHEDLRVFNIAEGSSY